MDVDGKNRKICYVKVDTSKYGEVNVFKGHIPQLASAYDTTYNTFKKYKNKIK